MSSTVTRLVVLLALAGSLAATPALGDVELVSKVPKDKGVVRTTIELTLGPDGSLFLPALGAPFAPGDPVFRVNLTDKPKVIRWFDGDSPGGEQVRAPLLLAADGYFYGSTWWGAQGAHGAFFRLSPSGKLKVLYELDPNKTEGDSRAETRLTEADDGNFYGGLNGSPNGHLFQLKPGGQFKVLHTFDSITEGNGLIGVMQASDGYLYGTLQVAGAGGCGALFRATTKGRVRIIHSFDSADNAPGGCYPAERLVEGPDRRLYGKASYGGTQGFNGGVAFRIDLDTLAFEKIHDFNPGTEGSYGWDGFVVGSDGNLYGTSSWGGLNGYGTAFRMTPSGAVDVLHHFGQADFIWPNAGLTFGGDGNLYGTATSASSSASVVYRIRLVP